MKTNFPEARRTEKSSTCDWTFSVNTQFCQFSPQKHSSTLSSCLSLWSASSQIPNRHLLSLVQWLLQKEEVSLSDESFSIEWLAGLPVKASKKVTSAVFFQGTWKKLSPICCLQKPCEANALARVSWDMTYSECSTQACERCIFGVTLDEYVLW